jgi:hypothetical protein
MPNSARTAYLFQCTGADLYAVSHDKTGANIPRSSCTQGWELCEEFQRDRGFFCWGGVAGGRRRASVQRVKRVSTSRGARSCLERPNPDRVTPDKPQRTSLGSISHAYR